MQDDLPRRSAEGLSALDIFYDGFNERNFYFEDEEQEAFYEELVRRLFPRFDVARVFCLSGKTSVLAHRADAANDAIPNRIYILDKDFDDILGKQVVGKNLFYLDAYCIENYLLEETAAVEVVLETHPRMARARISQELSVIDNEQRWLRDLDALFKMFVFVRRNDVALRNCDCVPEEFTVKRRHWEVSAETIDRYADSLVSASESLSMQPPLGDPLADERIQCDLGSPHGYISGKFMLALLFHLMKYKFRMGSITFDSFRFRMLKNSSLERLRPFAERVQRSFT